ncbi:MAG: hypothetical protein ACKO96_32195, partial [Flammeovirgaceae bacterium]
LSHNRAASLNGKYYPAANQLTRNNPNMLQHSSPDRNNYRKDFIRITKPQQISPRARSPAKIILKPLVNSTLL